MIESMIEFIMTHASVILPQTKVVIFPDPRTAGTFIENYPDNDWAIVINNVPEKAEEEKLTQPLE